jgi:gluconate 5-dehydrogenase
MPKTEPKGIGHIMSSLKLFDLTGKLALVTGSGKGLGLVLARGLAEAGARVILNGRDEQKLSAAVARLKEAGLDVYGQSFDVTKKSAIDRGVSAVEQTLGPIDILVNNAGIQRRGDLAEVEESVWLEVLETNLTSAFLTSQRAVRSMIARKKGKIINVCSMQSELGRKTTGPYTASKGGLKMLTKAMTADWARHNIQINGIGPGYFITEMTKPLADNPEFDAWLKNRTPAGRWGYPEELIGTIVFLASEASDFVTGQIVYVDGGILACL